jgi:hypothetical protein
MDPREVGFGWFWWPASRRRDIGAGLFPDLLVICGQLFLSETRNGRKSSIGAGFQPVLLATMASQQAVAKRSVGRRVTLWTRLFFGLASARRIAPSHRCAM